MYTESLMRGFIISNLHLTFPASLNYEDRCTDHVLYIGGGGGYKFTETFKKSSI
jgi:hypothetical protein